MIFINSHSKRLAENTLFVLFTFLMFGVCSVNAQTSNVFNENSIAQTHVIFGDKPVSGDIVSFDKETQKFNLSKIEGDSNLFGVVVTDPVIVLTSTNGGVPIARAGEVLVNVTTLGGNIHAGDLITSSKIQGKGQKADVSDKYIIGTALQPFVRLATSTSKIEMSTTTNVIYSGSIEVLLDVGLKSTTSNIKKTFPASTTPLVNNSKSQIEKKSKDPFTIPIFIKYIIAATIGIGSIVIAFKNFGSNIRNSVVSVGRNPLAKSSIQSIMVLDTILIILISMAGLFVGFTVLFLPL